MKTSCKSFEVFEFKEEGESEFAARLKSKLENPNAIEKYKFLENVAQGINIPSKEIGSIPCVDVDAVIVDHNGDSVISYTSLVAEEDSTKKMPEVDDVRPTSSTVAEQLPQSRPNKLEPRILLARAEGSGAASPSNSKLNCAIPDSSSSDGAVDMVPDADGSIRERSLPFSDIAEDDEGSAASGAASPSNSKLNCAVPDSSSNDGAVDMVPDVNGSIRERSLPSSDIADDDVVSDGPSSDYCVGGWEMDYEDTTVVFYPDYMVYGGKYCTDSVLTFSCSYIEMKGLVAHGDRETFQWAIDDIIHIESHWHERINLAMVMIHLLPKAAVQAEDEDGTLGIELKFAVIDSNWYEKQAAITSLNVTYEALWSSTHDANMGKSCAEAVLGDTRVFITKYFPNFNDPFEDVVYPKGDSDAVSISKRDVDLLQPDTFVNDTIIDFYIKYLKNKIKPEERHRFHFFNSFFYRKLADPDKDPSNASEGRAAFQRVRKWTRKVNLFEKDYVFIPVNFNYHWSLLVMCHLGEAATFQDEDVKNSIKVPCILHMDSIKGTHSGLKGLVQSYIWEEWKERQKEASEDISSRFYNLRFVSLELPQQQNSFDCGLFLLHYVELFLEQAPVNFNPFKITKFSKFLNVDWFQPTEASLKRGVIQRLIYDLLQKNSRETSPAAGNDEQCTFNCQKVAEFLPEKCNPSQACPMNVLSSRDDQGIEISLFPSSSIKVSQCAIDPGLVLREPFEPGLFLDAQYPAFNQSAPFDEFKSCVTPMEEEVEAGGQFVYPPMETGLRQLAGITPEVYAYPCSTRAFRVGTTWNSGISGHEEHGDGETSPETSISGSSDSAEEVNENCQVDADLNFEEKIDQPRSPISGSDNSVEQVKENSQVQAELNFEKKIYQPRSPSLIKARSPPLTETTTEPIERFNGDANEDDLTSYPGNPLELSSPCSSMPENGCAGSEDSSGSESDVQRAAKKMRLALEGEGGLTSSPSKDLHL